MKNKIKKLTMTLVLLAVFSPLVLVVQPLDPNTNLIKKEIIEYIEDEFSSTLIIIKDMFSKYFDGTYKKEDFKYKDILKMQEKRLEAERKRGRTMI